MYVGSYYYSNIIGRSVRMLFPKSQVLRLSCGIPVLESDGSMGGFSFYDVNKLLIYCYSIYLQLLIL